MTEIMTLCMHKDIKSNNTTRGKLLLVSEVDKGETKGVEFWCLAQLLKDEIYSHNM